MFSNFSKILNSPPPYFFPHIKKTFDKSSKISQKKYWIKDSNLI